MSQNLILDLINIKPKESIFENTIGEVSSLKADCYLRDINFCNNTNNNIYFINIIEMGTAVKIIKDNMNKFKSHANMENIYFIIDCTKNKGSFFKNNIFLLRYFFSFKVKSLPTMIFSFNDEFFANKIVPEYPNYLNKNSFFILKVWIKQIIINFNSYLRSRYMYVICKLEHI